MAELKVYSAISSMNAMLREGRAVPLSGLVMVNRQRMEQLLNDLEAAVPEELERAEKLLSREKELLDKIESQRIETESKANSEARKTIDDANQQAQKTIRDAKQEAESTVNNARAAANETVRQATEHANQVIMGAQDHANRLIAKAQTDAARMVSENNITVLAEKRAEETRRSAEIDCQHLHQETMDNLHQMLEHADRNLAMQLDALRALRQQLGDDVEQPAPASYEDMVYPDNSYTE